MLSSQDSDDEKTYKQSVQKKTMAYPSEQVKKKVQSLPSDAGCYLFLNAEKKIIYVGKAKNLRRRVSSYFTKDHKTSPKTAFLVSKIVDLQHIAVDTEVESLLLENQLIKQHRPKYNIMLKDDKRYAWLVLTKETFPRLISTRKRGLRGEYFGPYTDGYKRVLVQQLVQQFYQLRTCKTMPKKVCLLYHIKLCTGPCQAHVNKEKYAQQVEKARQFLKGDTKDIRSELKASMKDAAAVQAFERAKVLRDHMHALDALEEKQKVETQRRYDQDVMYFHRDEKGIVLQVFSIRKGVIRAKKEHRFTHVYEDDFFSSFLRLYYSHEDIPHEILVQEEPKELESLLTYLSSLAQRQVQILVPQRGEKKQLLEMAKKNVMQALQADPRLLDLKMKLRMKDVPRVIDCFDISHFQGAHNVAAMVHFENGEPKKSGYRRFTIKSVDGANDFASMKEAVHRQYKRLRDEKQPLPDLIVIDGGKGQLSFAKEALDELGVKIPMIALAKKLEEIFVPGSPFALRFDPDSPALLLLREIRDATHNFVITFYRSKHKKGFVESELDKIDGVGARTKEKLFVYFKSVNAIKNASLEELQDVCGKKMGTTIHSYFEEKE